MIVFRRIAAISCVSVVLLSAARPATAQCDGPKRAPTAAEAKSYHDGFALFQRMAPPTPPGWTATDSNTDDVSFVCPDPFSNFMRWTFSRTFNRSQAEMQARGAAALKKTEAAVARAEERRKAKVAKLADIERRQADLAKRVGAAAEQNNIAALAAISAESDKLAAEREALEIDDATEAEMAAIRAEVDRDSTAQFTLIFGETDVSMSSAFKPMPSAVGKGYRQDGQDKSGNPSTDLVVVLPPVPGNPGRPAVRISGDTARAESLLKGTKLR